MPSEPCGPVGAFQFVVVFNQIKIFFLNPYLLNYLIANFHQYFKFTSEHIVSVKLKVDFASDLACVSFTSVIMGE